MMDGKKKILYGSFVTKTCGNGILKLNSMIGIETTDINVAFRGANSFNLRSCACRVEVREVYPNDGEKLND